MHHRIRGELLHGEPHRHPVGQIGLVKGGPRVHRRAMPLGQIVEYRHFMPPIEHLFDADTPDVARPAGYQ